MRFSGFIVSLFACMGLALMPIAQPHAHIHGGHGDVFVHGGHDHDFEFAPLDFHDDDHEHGEGGDEHELPLMVDDLPSLSAHAHIVKLDSTAVQHQLPTPTKVFSAAHVRVLDPPIIRTVAIHPPPAARLPSSPAHLYPPLRGPPSFIP